MGNGTFVHQDVLTSVVRWVRSGHDVVLVGDTGSGRSTVLRALVAPLRASGAAVVELLGAGTGDAVPLGAFTTHPVLRPRSGRAGPAEAVAVLAEALGSRSAVVLVDDVHLLDRASLTVVAAAVRQRPDQVRVVTTLPASAPDSGAPLSNGAVVERVPPVGVDATVALLSDALGGLVEVGLAAAVAGRSGGNPRVVKMLAAAALAAGAVGKSQGRWAQTGSLEAVPTEPVVHALIGHLPTDQRAALDVLAWFGLLDLAHARMLVGDDVLRALDHAGRIAVDEHSRNPAVAVSPPVLGHALRLGHTPARRALLRERAGEILGTDVPTPEQGPRLVGGLEDESVAPDDRPVHQQVAIITESVRTRAALWSRAWSERRDVASALPLLRLHLVDGLVSVDVDEVFAGTSAGADDDPDEVGAYVLLRAQWSAQCGGTVREGLLHDPGPSGRLVLPGAREPFLAHLDAVYRRGVDDAVVPDLADIDDERDVPDSLRGLATILRVQAAIEDGAPDRALELLGSWTGSARQQPFTHQLDALRGDALLLVGQVDDAVSWARSRLSAAYDELSPFGIRLASRCLATALFLRGEHARARRALSVVLRLGRCGPVQSPFDERVFALAAVLYARDGRPELARTLLEELDGTPRPYAPAMDFMRPWARLEVEAATGGDPDADALWKAGEELWGTGRVASAAFCWALTPQQLPQERLARLEEVFAATRLPVLGPAVRLHRYLDHGTSGAVIEAMTVLRARGPLARVAVRVAQERAAQEGRRPLTAEEAAVLIGADPRTARPVEGESAGLTARELEIVDLARSGHTNREIASRLFLSVRTVENHLYRAMQKLGVSDRRALVG
ncbi:LuxR C-terminal-related transcriptional regulator [Cellulosimicrobium sp. PMB13]|uniref:helix-turn-helix transcriptional regulator n=1 Tax=Cellulosimicrobium sp. PMB13 TaxID=3120158 RepID=UPI003F4BA952